MKWIFLILSLGILLFGIWCHYENEVQQIAKLILLISAGLFLGIASILDKLDK